MQLFQKSIPVLLLLFVLIVNGLKASAQENILFPASFSNDSIASFRLTSTNGQKLNYKAAHKLSCFVFLSPDCPLCKNYAALINHLEEEYSATISFYLVVPGRLYSTKEINGFSNGYLKKSVVYRDKNVELSRYLRATVTPEAVLLESKNGKTIYAGALDNWAVSLGKQRTKATENYLHDAIESYLQHQPPSITFKEPVGCFINDF